MDRSAGEPLHVLHAIPTLDARAGGPPVALIGLAEAQAAEGLSVTVISTHKAGDDRQSVDALRKKGVEVISIGPAKGPLLRHPQLAGAVRDAVARADVVHIHALWEEIQHQAARAAQARGIPYLVTPHGMLDPWSLAQSKWRKRIYRAWRLNRMLRRASAIHYITEMERDACRGLGLRAPTIVEPIGISLKEFEDLPPRDALRRRFPQIGSRPIIVFLGRVHPGKGLEHLVPALAQVRGVEPVLVAVGPDSEGFQSTIEASVRRLGLQDRVIFTGMLKGRDRIEALAGADLFALPSDHENFGLAVVEALAAGTPVVVSRQVGIHREIEPAGVGAAVPQAPDVLAAELSRWLTDASLRCGAASRCRPFVWKAFEWRRIAARWAEHYGRIPRPRKSPGAVPALMAKDGAEAG